MKKSLIACTIIVFFTVMLFILTFASEGFCYHRNGDVNGDGWFNWADLYSFMCHFQGDPLPYCLYWGGDCNGDGNILGSDMVCFVNYFRGSGHAPIGVCDNPVLPCDVTQEARIWLSSPTYAGNTATIQVNVSDATVDIAAFHFAFIYDANIFSNFTTVSHIPSTSIEFNDNLYSANFNIVTFSFTHDFQCAASDFSNNTHVFDISVDRAGGAPAGEYELCIADDDPIYGPPRLYGDSPGYAERAIRPLCEIMVAGDCNGDGIVIGSDVTYLVNYFRGHGTPPVNRYFCKCVPIKWQ